MRKICVIGLGYVGLPLAVEFAKKYQVVGFDINQNRIKDLIQYRDSTLEVSEDDLKASKLKFTHQSNEIADCGIYIITVPTPINQNKQPDLNPLMSASRLVGSVLKKNDIVIYESTVYPGCTEEDCVPVLEQVSGLKYNVDFFCGYSPERMNPGDKEKTVSKIVKVTSGSTPEVAETVNNLYASIITAGTYKASSIKVAEAAKIIENTQRDINIAFVNELSLIFSKMGLDTLEVLEAAGTKWNFLPFKPGLVGGHCIGVDPYYLTFKAESLGYHPQVILSGRRINDGMGQHVANQVVKLMIKKSLKISESKVLILGLTFKENCPDTRNSKVFDIIQELNEFGCQIDVFDPWVLGTEDGADLSFRLVKAEATNNLQNYGAVILAVAHKQFKEIDLSTLDKSKTVLFDLKGAFSQHLSDARL